MNEATIDEWLHQFKAADRDVAARVLDAVEFFNQERIAHQYRTLLAALPGWHPAAAQRQGKWKFVAMSSSDGDSGGTMLHQFRIATGFSRRIYDGLFAHRSELLQLDLGADDTVVFLDDFIGTGNQVSTAWHEAFSELVAGVGNVYLMVVAARRDGVDRVQVETGLSVQYGVGLDDTDDIFSDRCQHFTAAEKAAFLHYCRKANRKEPEGFGKCGLVVVFLIDARTIRFLRYTLIIVGGKVYFRAMTLSLRPDDCRSRIESRLKSTRWRSVRATAGPSSSVRRLMTSARDLQASPTRIFSGGACRLSSAHCMQTITDNVPFLDVFSDAGERSTCQTWSAGSFVEHALPRELGVPPGVVTRAACSSSKQVCRQ